MMRFCKECDTDITKKIKRAKFCSDKCRNDYWLRKHPRYFINHKSKITKKPKINRP